MTRLVQPELRTNTTLSTDAEVPTGSDGADGAILMWPSDEREGEIAQEARRSDATAVVLGFSRLSQVPSSG